MALLREARTAFWHLRRGGLAQLRSWNIAKQAESGFKRPEQAKGAEASWIRHGFKRRLSFSAAEIPVREPRRSDLRVGVILDEFSQLAFAYEWHCLELTPSKWREQLTKEKVDFVFVESAWAGNSGQWKYQLTGESGPKQAFIELMEWCRKSGIPTAFWNKEDPPHYTDFLSAARLFDVVFTSDSKKISSYASDLGHDRIEVLAFAAQPAVHNPIRTRFGSRERDIAFAGMYFGHKYPERRQQMDLLLGGAIDASSKMNNGLEIFSRQLGGEVRYQFPEPYGSRVVGSLDYKQILMAYKAYKIFLNVNSVIDSPSMCSRRIFEITAAGAAVMTATSAAIEQYFEPDELVTVESREEAAYMARALVRNPELADRFVHKAQRKIWSLHTYAHRAEEVVAATVPNRARPVTVPPVSAIVSTIRPHQLEYVFRTIGSQLNIKVELVLLTHGFDVPTARMDELCGKYGISNLVTLSKDRDTSLGECLNSCVKAASGTVVTKMDDDDYYGPQYIADQANALMYSTAAVVGKQAHYMYIEARNATLLRFADKEHRFTRMVMGPTLMGERAVFAAHPFEAVTQGEDTRFLRSVIADGGTIYSADRFNYFQHRHSAGHTWNVRDEELLASAEVKFFGSPVEHTTI